MLLNFALHEVKLDVIPWESIRNEAVQRGSRNAAHRRASRAENTLGERLIPVSIKQNHPITDAARAASSAGMVDF